MHDTTHSAPRTTAVDPRLAEIQGYYDRGLYVQGHAAGTALFGPINTWQGPEARILATRLASNLGAGRTATSWLWRTWREYPDHPLVQYYVIRSFASRRGPWQARNHYEQIGELKTDDRILRADWMAFKGVLAALFRDFEAADRALDAAEAIAPDSPWVHLERSEVLMYEDRHDEALAASQRSLELRPWYRPGIQSTAHLLTMRNRDDEALEMLRGAAEVLESGDILFQLSGMLMERKRYAEARETIERIPALCPLMEKKYLEALSAQRSDAAYHCGDEAAAVEHARQAGKGFHEKLAERLAAAKPEARRYELDVPFVRQHHVTCAPATLTAIAKYWKREVEHLEVAEKICYDGTPAQGERQWAEQNGFLAREFTVDLPTAEALVSRGVPFTFTTVEPTNSHLQAVAGYDARRQTLLLRDSNYRGLGELTADKGLEHYAPTGPRGMVLMPPEEASRIRDVALPDAELYDRLYELLGGLDKFDRAVAARALERLREQAPTHRLTLIGRRAMAAYDNDLVGGRHACEQLVHQYPESDVWLFGLWFYLRRLAPRDERLKFLQKVLDRHDSDPVFRLHLAEELCDDARTHPEAERVLRKFIRRRPLEARAYSLLGQIAWLDRRYDEALRFYYTAACLEDKDEDLARTYFAAARRVKRTEEALEFLRRRFQRFGAKSSYPARTLYAALNTLDRAKEAFAVLADAVKLRRDDGRLLLFVADCDARAGRFERAGKILKMSEGKCHPHELLRTRADIASYRGDLAESLAVWRELLAQDPQSIDAAASIARLLTELDGRDASVAFLRDLVDRFPHNVALIQTAAEFLREEQPEEAERLVRRLVEFNPVDPWARRELAIVLTIQRRFDEALEEITAAIPLEPTNSVSYSIHGRILETLTRLPEAEAAYRRALELSIDNEAAFDGLLRTQHDHAHRKAALEFIYKQLVGQMTYGEGLTAYSNYAVNVFPPEQVLQQLHAALKARPDLWHAWSAVIRQLVEMEKFDQAQALAEREVERFSLLPGSYVDLAMVCRLRGDTDGEISALRRALEISPVWSVSLRQLVDAYQRRGEYAQAQAFVEQALQRNPTDAVLLGHLADLQWRDGKKAETLATLERAVMLEPGYNWAWGRLHECGAEMKEPDRAAQAARKLVERAPTHARSWLVLARVLDGDDYLEERLAALSKVAELNPLLLDGYTQRSKLLAQAGRFDEAIAACRPTAFGATLPPALGIQEACVLEARGDRAAAVAKVRAVLADNPDRWDAWSQLAQWFETDEAEKKAWLEAAERMIDLAPTDALSWRTVADARRVNDDPAGARQAYARAVTLDPAFEYCTNWLVDLELDAGEVDRADEFLKRALAHEPSAFLLARRVLICGKRKQRAAAIDAFRQVLEQPQHNAWPINAGLETLTELGAEAEAIDALRTASIRQGGEVACEKFIEICAAKGHWVDGEAHLQKTQGSVRHAGLQQLLRSMAERGQGERVLALTKRRRDELAGDPLTWGVAGYALCSLPLTRLNGIQWMSDWRKREGVESWMLLNLANALEAFDRLREAKEVRQAGVDMDPQRHVADHRVYLALHHCTAGDYAAAAPLVEEIDGSRLDADSKAALAMVLAALRLSRADVPSGFAGWTLIREYNAALKLFGEAIARDPALQKFRKRTLVRLLKKRGHTWSAVIVERM
jgi:tetratricopeptide (TPR) repeat protein